MDLSLTGKRALVGGASRGIGQAAAIELALLGASITCVARNEDRLLETIRLLDTSNGQTHHALAGDAGDPETLAGSVAELAATSPYHIVVNNTGGPPDGPANTASPEEFKTAFTQHVLCNQLILAAVLPGMREAGYGRIINVISTSVKQPIPGLGVSNTIRGAVANWAKTLASELGPDGITVNNVLPGFTDTDRLADIVNSSASRSGRTREQTMAAMKLTVPLRRFAKAEETASAIAFLASPAASYINGINLPVDGGRTGSL
jgi:3-oxoacyl-[acyl-carrier protein] reductase